MDDLTLQWIALTVIVLVVYIHTSPCRFLSKQRCEDMCVPEEDWAVEVTSVCDLPRAEGACAGNFSREAFYNDRKNDGPLVA